MSEPKVPPYQPHETHVAQREVQFHKPFPPLPANDGISPIQPLRPTYNGRPHFIHDTTRLTIPQIQDHFSEPSPTYTARSGKSSHLAVQSWLPDQNQPSWQEHPSTLRSHFSQSSLIADLPFVMRFRIFVMRWIIEWWLMEIISWTFSALCMITIILVLFAYDHNELPRWPLGLTLNSLISALSASAKAALLLPTAEAIGQLKWNWFSKDSRSLIDFEVLDAASRGPWGSVLLLLKAMREKGLNLASIGAVIMILCLPLDLFFQQVINYEKVYISMPMNATLPRAVYYQSNGRQIVNGTEGLGPDYYVNNVFSPYFYSNATTPTPRSYCPTSNCTWEPFETLAVCSSCSSVTELLEFGCFEGPASWLTEVTSYSDPTIFPNMTQCGWFLNATDPDSRVLMTGYIEDPITQTPGETLDTRLFPLVDAFTFEPYWGGSINFKDDIPIAIANVLIAYTPGGRAGVHAREVPIAQECLLSWCTQTLTSSASWGSISENVTNIYKNISQTGFPYSATEDELFYTSFPTFTPPDQHSVTHENKSIIESPLTFGLSNETAFQVITTTMLDIPSFITSTDEGQFYKNRLWWVEGAYIKSLAENPWLGDAGADSRFDDIARGLTNAIRNDPKSDGSQEVILGTSWDERTHVMIRWPWIILPLVLLALSLLLLTCTVLKSTQEESVVGIWKTSVIAILFNGIDETVQRSVSPNCRMTEARAKAREFRVKLVPE